MLWLAALYVFVAGLACSVHCQSVYVASGGIDAVGRGTMTAPLRTIQYALSSTNASTVVLVDSVVGGALVDRSVSIVAYGTQSGIDCAGTSTTGLTLATEDAVSVSGITIRNCRNGGMYVRAGAPIITSCRMSVNAAVWGGGVAISAGTPQFRQCFITGNSAGYDGGGVFSGGNSAPVFTNCEVSGNSASGNGGGVVVTGSSTPAFDNCIINSNVCNAHGGGVFLDSDASTFVDCAISHNSVDLRGYGGGVSIRSGSPSFDNCVISHDYAVSGGAVYVGPGSLAPSFVNTRMYTNTDDSISVAGGVSYFSCLVIDGVPIVGLPANGVNVVAGSMLFPPCVSLAYVSSAGSDANRGTFESPFRSLQYALGSGAADIVVVGPVGGGAIISRSVRIRAGDAQGGIDCGGAGVVGLTISTSMIVSVTGVGVSGCSATGGHTGGGIVVTAGSHVFSSCTISNNKGGGVSVLAGMSIFLSCIIYGNGASGGVAGVTIFSGSPAFSACDMHDNAGTGVSLLAGSPKFIACTISNNLGHGLLVAAGSPEFFACDIRANIAGVSGNGVRIQSGAPSFVNCSIDDHYDSGVYVGSGSAMFVGCSLRRNMAFQGAGVYVASGAPTMVNCSIVGNRATGIDSGGSGVYVSSGGARFEHCTVSDNSAYYGGGVLVASGSPTFVNCNLTGNSAERGGGRDVGGGVLVRSGAPTFANLTMSANTPDSMQVQGGNATVSCLVVDGWWVAFAPAMGVGTSGIGSIDFVASPCSSMSLAAFTAGMASAGVIVLIVCVVIVCCCVRRRLVRAPCVAGGCLNVVLVCRSRFAVALPTVSRRMSLLREQQLASSVLPLSRRFEWYFVGFAWHGLLMSALDQLVPGATMSECGCLPVSRATSRLSRD